MGLAADIETKIKEAVTANEASDFDVAETKLRSAILLMAGHPKIKFEDSETEYLREDLVAMLKEIQTKASSVKASRKSSGGFTGIPIRNRIG